MPGCRRHGSQVIAPRSDFSSRRRSGSSRHTGLRRVRTAQMVSPWRPGARPSSLLASVLGTLQVATSLRRLVAVCAIRPRSGCGNALASNNSPHRPPTHDDVEASPCPCVADAVATSNPVCAGDAMLRVLSPERSTEGPMARASALPFLPPSTTQTPAADKLDQFSPCQTLAATPTRETPLGSAVASRQAPCHSVGTSSRVALPASVDHGASLQRHDVGASGSHLGVPRRAGS